MLRPRRQPCSSCPYRRDVPSGIWEAEEYAKLPGYDGDVPEQIDAGALGVFMCHQADGQICAGWAGCHDMANSLAIRLATPEVDPAIVDYRSPVPLFGSGAEAAEHGMRDVAAPGEAAVAKAEGLRRTRARRAGKTKVAV
jgi:Family of unknown function (DUF6283)